jgi:hypothetical protein
MEDIGHRCAGRRRGPVPKTHDATGRTLKCSGNILAAPPQTTTRAYRRRNKIAGQFAPRLIEMLEAPAYRIMSLSAHRLLDRLEIEYGHHAGRDNGKLPVTYDDFVDYGIERHSIAPAMREVEALGFAQVTDRGRAGNAEYRTPNKFRLTYRPTDDRGATDEWRAIKTIEEAKAIAQAARKLVRRDRPQTKGVPEKQNPMGAFPRFSGGNPHRKLQSPVGETPTTVIVGKPPLLSISTQGVDEASQCQAAHPARNGARR